MSAVPDRARKWPWLALLLVYAAHVGLVVYFFGDRLPLPEQPFSRGDFATHAAQTHHVVAGLQTAGKAWVYDVQLLAGSPNGVLFDADVKAWELWTWALVEMGVGEGKAYNAFVLFLHLLMPLVVYTSARLFELDRGAATLATALSVGLWFFDSFTHWMWFIGTVSYVLAAYFALLPLALFHRWLEDRRPIFALGCGLSLALGHLDHPYTFFILVIPMTALYLRASVVERSMSGRDHLITLGVGALTLAVNFWWLRTASRFFHYILDSAFYAQGGLEFLFYDLLGLLHEPMTQGMIGPRTALRLLAAIAACCGLRAWYRAADRRFLPWASLIITLAAFTYLGGYTPLAQIQPYRHALPLGFALMIPAADWLITTARERPWLGLAAKQRVLAGTLAALSLLHLSRDVLYFFADSMRERQVFEASGFFMLMNTLGHAYTPRYRYQDQDDWSKIVSWVAKRDDGQGRWLIQDPGLGEYLTARTEAQVIGGFEVRNLEHSDANWWRAQGLPPYEPLVFAHYLERYAVHYIVLTALDLHPWWDQQRDLIIRAGVVGNFVVFQVRQPGRLIDGEGEVHAELNRIEIHGSDPDRDLLLRYHWMETLRCAPDCEIERVRVEGDRVGFMRVPAPHAADFDIENSYEF